MHFMFFQPKFSSPAPHSSGLSVNSTAPVTQGAPLPGIQMVLWNPPPAGQSWKFPVGQPDLSCCLPPHPESSPNPGIGVECKVSVPEAPSWAAQAIGGGCVCRGLYQTPTATPLLL